MSPRLNNSDIAQIVKMRGLGYSQSDIADHLGVSQSTVQYHLRRIRERAEDEGDDNTFVAVLVGAGIGIGVGYLLAKLMQEK